MDITMTRLRVWRIWKKLKRFTILAAYEDRATGDRVFLSKSFQRPWPAMRDLAKGWPESELRLLNHKTYGEVTRTPR
jgi:hypothetical protein